MKNSSEIHSRHSAGGDNPALTASSGFLGIGHRFTNRMIVKLIRKARMEVLRQEKVSKGYGVKYTLIGGGVVTVYSTGRYQFQGTLSDRELRRLERAFAHPLDR